MKIMKPISKFPFAVIILVPFSYTIISLVPLSRIIISFVLLSCIFFIDFFLEKMQIVLVPACVLCYVNLCFDFFITFAVRFLDYANFESIFKALYTIFDLYYTRQAIALHLFYKFLVEKDAECDYVV